jgi:trans-2-enoyl-CoA reductase
MIIQPKTLGFIFLTSHSIRSIENVKKQIAFEKKYENQNAP